MKYRTVVILSIVNFILSSSIFQVLRINDAIPNFCIILSIVLLALVSKNHAYVFAGLSGLFQDVFLGRMIGTNLLVYILLVYIASRLISSLFIGNYATPIFVVSISTVLYHVLFYIIMFFFQATVPFDMLYEKILTEVVYNSLIGLGIYSIAFKRFNGYKLGDYNA